MNYKINVAKKDTDGRYRFYFRIEDEDLSRIKQVWEDVKKMYTYPEYNLSTHLTISKQYSWSGNAGFDELNWKEIL